ncbi:MAG: phospho-N-acetylmuramoyl-pentapeptide-transferase [Anaerovoracaceae bacterium]
MEILQLLLLLAMAFMITTVATSLAIPVLKRKHAGQNIREEGPQSHLKKSGTPSMGGIAILMGIAITAIATKQFEWEVLIVMAALLAFGAIGFVDDYMKIQKKHNLGLRAWQKILMQLAVSGILAAVIAYGPGENTLVRIPISGQVIDLGAWYIPFGIFVLLAMVNSVNLTDGLDGLATGVTAISLVFFSLAGVTYHHITSAPLAITMAGACLGFLVFNRHPAKIFMGDTGSLALGGGLATLAMVMDLELFLPIVGFVYVAEALSVIMQVVSYKTTGKRIFRMAPLHHHFEISGLKETQVVALFWFVTLLFSVVGIGVL